MGEGVVASAELRTELTNNEGDGEEPKLGLLLRPQSDPVLTVRGGRRRRGPLDIR